MQIIIFIAVLVLLLLLLIFIMWYVSYNIPVTVLRFVGNKGRPLLIHTKAKKKAFKGVTRLKIRGYKMDIRDFKQDNYYPARRGKYGALLLFEFEDGYLTPTLPKKIDLSAEEKARLNELLDEVHNLGAGKFQFDHELHADLVLKAVDDVDVDFMIQEYARINDQYPGGWGEFFQKFGGHLIVAFIAIIMLVMVIVFFNKAPELATACANAAVDTRLMA
jgi:uncharacterized protein YggT (Ycf19 family)